MIMRIFFICFLFLLFSVCGNEPHKTATNPEPVTTSCLLMHTVVTLQAEGGNTDAAVSEALDRLAELEALTDPNKPGSDIARLNESAGHGPVQLSVEVFRILEAAQLLAELSNGAFDCTLLPVSRLYSFGTSAPQVPDERKLTEALTHTGWRKLQLDKGRLTAELTEDGMAIDLGAAVKGFAADEVRRILQKHGVSRALCSFGHSTVLALGSRSTGQPWQIGLQHPRKAGELSRIVPLENQVLSVSGDYERFFIHEGERYHHLLSPQDGRPARELQSVTVIIGSEEADAGLWSDMLSTACFVLGKEKTGRLLKSLPVKVQHIIME